MPTTRSNPKFTFAFREAIDPLVACPVPEAQPCRLYPSQVPSTNARCRAPSTDSSRASVPPGAVTPSQCGQKSSCRRDLRLSRSANCPPEPFEPRRSRISRAGTHKNPGGTRSPTQVPACGELLLAQSGQPPLGIPSARVPPIALGVSTRRVGGGMLLQDNNRLQSLYKFPKS